MADELPLFAPVDLDVVKDDLGITDDYSDAWLARRCDSIWSRFQTFTGRPLLLSSQWIDDWSAVPNSCWLEWNWQRRPTFLGVYPVQSINAWTRGETVGDISDVVFDRDSGQIISFDDLPFWNTGLPPLVSSDLTVTYTAGFETLPGDLYEALIGCLSEMWAIRQLQVAGGGTITGRVSSISAADVGDVQFSTDTTIGFAGDASKKITSDPMLGPWKAILQPYRDERSFLGGPRQKTTAVLS